MVGYTLLAWPEMNNEARRAQVEYHGAEADCWGKLFNEGIGRLKDWTFKQPLNYDFEEWHGVARYCAVDLSYRWHIDRERILKAGRRPFYCPTCHDDPGDGWFVQGCYDCAWTAYLAQEALKAARELGEQWTKGIVPAEFIDG